jgi:signal transduction histidine kinase
MSHPNDGHAEQLLREEGERLRMAVKATGLGTWDYLPTSGTLTWSGECRAIFDLPPDQPVNCELFLDLVHNSDLERVNACMANTVSPEGTGICDIRFRIIRFGDRHIRWIHMLGKAYFVEGAATRVIGAMVDITEAQNKQAEVSRLVVQKTKELHNTNDLLIRRNNDLEHFVHIASSGLPEPLLTIQILAEKLQHASTNQMTEELREGIDNIVSASRRLSILLGNMLDHTGDGAQELFVTTDLNNALATAQKELEQMTAKENALVHSDKLPIIDALPRQMQQLFYNIIHNSIKFRAEERVPVIIITCRPLSRAETFEQGLNIKKDYFKIDISDNGIGFDAKVASSICSGSDLRTNTGVGLIICRKIVDTHKGLLFAKGRDHKGARITIILPATPY